MDKETKIVLAIKGERALYLFKREFEDFTEVKFVVGWMEGNPAIGDYVSGWSNGQYVVYNTWFDERFGDFDTDRETLDIEVEGELEC